MYVLEVLNAEVTSGTNSLRNDDILMSSEAADVNVNNVSSNQKSLKSATIENHVIVIYVVVPYIIVVICVTAYRIW